MRASRTSRRPSRIGAPASSSVSRPPDASLYSSTPPPIRPAMFIPLVRKNSALELSTILWVDIPASRSSHPPIARAPRPPVGSSAPDASSVRRPDERGRREPRRKTSGKSPHRRHRTRSRASLQPPIKRGSYEISGSPTLRNGGSAKTTVTPAVASTTAITILRAMALEERAAQKRPTVRLSLFSLAGQTGLRARRAGGCVVCALTVYRVSCGSR